MLQRHVKSGRLEILTNTTVVSQHYSNNAWALATDPPTPELPLIDYIYFATGVASSITTLPLLRPILAKHPIPTFDGLPALTDDLAWSEDLPLFVTGKFAGLRLGPGAANLEGARAGAERVALALEGLLGDVGVGERKDSGFEDEGVREKYVRGVRSMFEGLEVEA